MNSAATNDLAHYTALTEWAPRVGDAVVWHGLLTHWFGVVNYVGSDGFVSVIKAGIPLLLLTLTEPQMEKNTTKIHISEIKQSTGGKFSVMQAHGNNLVWFV